MRILRLLSLLFACSLAPIVFAQTAALELTKVGLNEADPPGSIVSIPVSFANRGPAYALDARLTMTIPPGATFVGASPGCAGPPAGQSGDVVCSFPYLSSPFVGSTFGLTNVDFVVKLDSAAPPGLLAFPVTLTCSNAFNPPQTGTAAIQVIAFADVTIAMTSPSVVNGGTTFDNVVTVTNNGPGAAVLTQVEVRFDNSAPKPPAAPAGWKCTTFSAYVNCTPTSSFGPGAVTLTFPATAASSGSMTQTALVSLFNDANDRDNQAVTTTAATAQQTPPTAAVKLTLAGAPDVVHPGDLLTYTAKIANTSIFDAQGVILTWVLPGEIVSTTCGVTYNASCVFSTIAAGATQTVTRTIRVDAAARLQLLASATVSASNIPFDSGTQAATLSTIVAETPQADVAVTINPAPATLQTGDVVTFTITAKNGGTSQAAKDVAVNFFLPSSLAFLLASPECKGKTAIICNAGTLDSGKSATFTITSRAVGQGTIIATASVNTTSPESDAGNNSATATVVINAPPPPSRRRAAKH